MQNTHVDHLTGLTGSSRQFLSAIADKGKDDRAGDRFPYLIEHILGGTAQQDGAGLGFLAIHDEGEELIANLLHLKETRPGANVALFDLLSPAELCR